jgi:class 3 adenylate cyclase/PAS domain-containing protein
MAERYENKQSRALSRTARGYGQKQRGIPSDDISEASRFRSSTDSRLEPRGSAESLNSLSDNPKRMLSNFNEVETGSSAQRSTKSRESKFADSRNRGSFNDSASMTSDNMRGKRGDQDSDLREDMRMFVEGKSFAVQRVNLAVYLSLLLIVAVTVAIYVVGQIHLDLIVEGGNLVDEAGDTRTSTQEVAYRVRCMESAAIGQLQANMSSFSRLLHESATSLESAATILFDHARAKEDLLKAWRRQDGAVVETYTPTTRSTGSLQMSAWDMYGWFVRQARTVADYNQSMFLPQSPNTAEFHQVIVNGPANVLDSVWTLIHRYEDMYDHVVQEERIMQWVLCGAILLIPLILVSFLYIPAMRSIERERNEILRLFLLVPKTQVGRICTQTKCHLAWISGGMLGDKDTGTDNEQSGVENGEHSERQARRAAKHRKTSHKSTTGRRSKSAVFFLSIRFAVVLVMATGLALALGAIVLSANYAFFAQAAEINYAGGRYAYVVRLTHLCSELIRNDVIYYTRSQLRERIQKGIAEIIELHDAVKYGSSKFKTPGSVGHLHAQDNLLFRPRCAQTAELRCMSLDAMFSSFVDRVREFITLADHDLFYGSAAFKYISEVGEIHLHYLLDESQRLYAEETAPIIDGSRKALGYVFGVSFPIIILLYVVLLHPVLNRVDKEVRRTRRMLAMVPLDVIGDVPAIEDFIRSHGRNDTTQEALENAVKESQQKTSSVLAASVDAVIEFDKELCITSVNPSAEKVLSCKATNVVGDTVDLFFPLLVTVQDAASVSLSAASDMKPASDLKANMTMLMSKKTEGGDGMVWETVIVRSDGQIFPAQVSLCIGRMQGDVYFAAFIRDLSVMKKQEQLLRTEREKSENLLSTILPKSIADRLKANDGPIVDTYDSVSVVFTDMVKFTETAAKMSPQAVIGLLSNLFSEMDNIAAKHGIEKIKALGDGYMGASGLFSRFNDHAIACVNWGHEVFAFLRKYNEQHATNIQFRIGIATGPVTAGVIGTSRLQFDIFGDTVNVASRMESHSIPGRIQVNRETYERIYDKVPCEERTITVKGKGEMTVFMVK